MGKELKLVEDFDFDMIVDFFGRLNRQGRGSEQTTCQALNLVGKLPQDAKVADLGCGSGGQTLTLATHTDGTIRGMDISPKLIDLFNARMKRHGYDDRVTGIVGSMAELPFEGEELDLIWAEGSIYNIGFRRGLNEWRKFLKTGGAIAVSEVSWLTPTRPEEINHFWHFHYAEIDTIPNKVKQMEDAGYTPQAHFIVPEDCWLDHFYKPMQACVTSFLEQYDYSETARQFAQNQLEEQNYYRKYKKYYGYVFYIGIKNE